MYCWKCSNEIDIGKKIGRLVTCPHCMSYLHCCFNCRFYDKLAFHECKEPQVEWVKEKNAANFCEYFTPVKGKFEIKKTLSKDEANKKFKELFRKKRL